MEKLFMEPLEELEREGDWRNFVKKYDNLSLRNYIEQVAIIFATLQLVGFCPPDAPKLDRAIYRISC